MPLIQFTLPDGTEQALAVPIGTTLMQAAVNANLPGILGECGGSAMCATCHVYVESAPEGALGDMSPVEDGMLAFTASERRANSRLSCQLTVTSACEGLKVRVPEHQV